METEPEEESEEDPMEEPMNVLPGLGPEPAQVPVSTQNSPMYIDISSDSSMALERSDSPVLVESMALRKIKIRHCDIMKHRRG
ncbi:unnamed protein product [Arabis nemorensis]|uniref:Uncharacterized protein n=1 Tax=Arabis nemorensis TaxID=586526 RepID=A0A565BEH2_9BRAS|nr:unnamed protein product [Arabis nemorensis]